MHFRKRNRPILGPPILGPSDPLGVPHKYMLKSSLNSCLTLFIEDLGPSGPSIWDPMLGDSHCITLLVMPIVRGRFGTLYRGSQGSQILDKQR